MLELYLWDTAEKNGYARCKHPALPSADYPKIDYAVDEIASYVEVNNSPKE